MGSFVAVSGLLTTSMESRSVIRGHHVYKEVWRPVIGQFSVLAEPTNCHDKRAVAIFQDAEIVGHIPRELASLLVSRSILY